MCRLIFEVQRHITVLKSNLSLDRVRMKSKHFYSGKLEFTRCVDSSYTRRLALIKSLDPS